MTLLQWLIFILVIQVIHGLGTWKLYVKAGRKAWEAFVPVYNSIVLMQIINRPKWWVILLFIPIINLLMFPIVWIETIRSFGRNSRQETFLVVVMARASNGEEEPDRTLLGARLPGCATRPPPDVA